MTDIAEFAIAVAEMPHSRGERRPSIVWSRKMITGALAITTRTVRGDASEMTTGLMRAFVLVFCQPKQATRPTRIVSKKIVAP